MVREAVPWLLSIAMGCSGAAPVGGPAPDPGEPESDAVERENGGQSGSPVGQAECQADLDCRAVVESELRSLSQAAPAPEPFARSECEAVGVSGDEGSVSGAACACFSSGSGGGGQIVGPRGAGCYATGRGGDCLWEDSQFTGCVVGKEGACTETCQDLHDRQAADARRSFTTELLYTACRDSSCHSVVRVDEKCFADRSYTRGQAYDCSQGPEAILAAHLAPASKPPPIPDTFGDSSMVPGTNGFVELGAYTWYSGTSRTTEDFSVYAQFYETLAGKSELSGRVLDPLTGIDDCGVVVPGGVGSAHPTKWLKVASLELTDGDHEYPVPASGVWETDYCSYSADLKASGVSPRYGGAYDLKGGGGTFAEAIAIRGLRLPEALTVPEFERASRFERKDLHLSWTGQGDAPLSLTMYVQTELRDGTSSHEIHCTLTDDGDFTIPAGILSLVPEGFALTEFRRANRAVVAQTGGKSLVAAGLVVTGYQIALGGPCDRSAVVPACHDYAAKVQSAYLQCGTVPPPSLAELCPDYLAEACGGCEAYFACKSKKVRCDERGLVFETDVDCTCP